jgi:LPXTG-motif cell wall-anchored protein
MRLFRPASAVLASALLAGAAFPGLASAQTASGVGTSVTSTKLLSAQLGDNGSLLDLTLVGDEARSTTDPAVAASEAYSRLTALTTKSSTISALNQQLGSFEAKSAGPTSVDIASLGVPAALSPVVTGDLTGKLSAALTNGVASTGMTADLSNLSLVGGLVSLDSLKSTQGSVTEALDSGAGRSAGVTNLTVLDLGALLKGLGIDPSILTLDQLDAILTQLNATTGLSLPAGSTTLQGAVTTLNAAITDLQGALAGAPAATSDITTAIDSTTSSLLGTIGITAPLPTTTDTLATAVTDVNAVIDQLKAQLAKLVTDRLAVLDSLSLLKLEGVDVGVTTKATDAVDSSIAQVTGKIGKIDVGGITLPGVDLLAATDTVNAVVNDVNAKIGGVLGTIDPSLANLVKVSVLDKATSITQDSGYTRSRAGITGATAVVTPPAALSTLISTLSAQANTVGSTLTAAGVPVPVINTAMSQLGTTLSVASALSAPAKVQVASVLSASDYSRVGSTTAGAPAPGSSLPRTGDNSSLFLLVGAVAAAAAFGLRRTLHTPAVRPVRIDDK